MSGAFGWAAAAFAAVYLAALFALTRAARRARRDEGLGDFFLAGRTLGGPVLLLTLYATQYSGNSLIAYPGEAYRLGYSWVMSVAFMTAIVVAYLPFAPQLHRLGRRHGFITPGDWIDHRFGSPALSLTANLLMVVAVANYLLAQLMAMGHVVEGLSGGAVPYAAGVLGLALVVIAYETLGGLRAVAWSDVLQGGMLLAGLAGVLAAAGPSLAELEDTTRWILAHHPDRAVVPSRDACLGWASTVLLVGVSGAVYPHAIQRIYAARSAASLRRSIGVMAFMPFATMPPVILIGLLGLRRLEGLGEIGADQVMPLLLREWAGESAWSFALALIVVAGVVAAIMSTADSVLLSLASILARDVVGKHVRRGATEEQLTRVGKRLSWAVMGLLTALALQPRLTLWGLIELKFEVLVQVAPLFLFGVGPRMQARPAMLGLVAGMIVAVGLTALGVPRPWGVHAGLLGFAVNLLLALGLSRAGSQAPAVGARPA